MHGLNAEAIPPITGKDSSYVALDYDAAEDYIYFSDVRKSAIFRIHLNGTGNE